jgi:hypothetical protein
LDRSDEPAEISGLESADFAVSNQPLIVYVDVDDTFVRSVGAKRIPMSQVIRHIRQLHQEGAILYCWSSGGGEYAKQSAQEFGSADCFVGFLPKPNVILDDQPVNEWRLSLHVHPTGSGGDSVEQYWNAIKKNRTLHRP